MRLSIALFILLAPASVLADGRIEDRPSGTTGAPYGYAVYTPPGYDAGTGAHPLIVFLHGTGEYGDGSAPSSVLSGMGPLRNIRDELARGEVPRLGREGVIVASPQTPVWWSAATLDAFFDHLVATYRVDASRIYLTGLSMGGGGTWDYAVAHPERLAAILPICGASWGDPGRAASLEGLPIWAFHALDDGTVGFANSTSWMNSMAMNRGASAGSEVMSGYPFGPGGAPAAMHQTMLLGADGSATWHEGTTIAPTDEVALTAYSNGNHYIWNWVYDQPESWTWLLAQRRGGAAPIDAGTLEDAGASSGEDAGVLPEDDAGSSSGEDAGVPSGDGGAAGTDAGPRADGGADGSLTGHMGCSARAASSSGGALSLLLLSAAVIVLRRSRAR